MKVEVTTITPAAARKYLENNPNNRRLAPSRVMHLAAMMRSGSWVMNGETIIISKSGALLDGQHRLAAVVEYGRPMDMLVATGAPDEAFTTIDTGASRSAGDILGIKGIAQATCAAAGSSIIWRLFHDAPHFIRVPPTYIVELIERYPAIAPWATRAHTLAKIAPPSVTLAACVYLDSIADNMDLAEALYVGLLSGENLEAGNPILTLRNRLITMRTTGVQFSQRTVWPSFARAISALEAGESLHKFRNVGPGSRFERPDMFNDHVERLTARERLMDLLPATATWGHGKNLKLVKLAA